ncbi:MAG: homocysteine S-methyltransferase family protein [Firmicutes bacterium]|nr:homocysteine S-methyltransferase family protein [Bacillota bacterium]
MGILELINKRRVYFDGAMGTVLQSMGLKAGAYPELWNLTRPDDIVRVHCSYLEAGSDIITANTFGANPLRFENWQEVIEAGIGCARRAVGSRRDKFVAYDIGPCGRLLAPLGELEPEKAIELFAAGVRTAEQSGADLIIIETMNDSMETKAAVLAAKENCSLPVFVANVYDESGTLMTGADPQAMVAMLEGLGVNAIGVNCSLGPDKIAGVIGEYIKYSSLPVIAMPNAGLPEIKDGKSIFGMEAEEFAGSMEELACKGVSILGGCCGTTPEYIKKTVAHTASLPYSAPLRKQRTVISSYTHALEIGSEPVIIGERINPTGKKKLKEALRSGDTDYILGEAIAQGEAGAHALDVNVGLPEIDEPAVLEHCVRAIQAVSDLPLQLDTSDPAALARAMRIYNGKPLINSVNGKEQSMREVFPLVKKYGGVTVALTLDENGIPDSAEGRCLIAQRIIETARSYGIDKQDIIVDPLAMAVSSDSASAAVTLETVKMLHQAGIRTSLGVSNISFGLPQRDVINTVFYANALACGLDCAIMNPFSKGMMSVYYAFRALNGMDRAFADYIAFAQGNTFDSGSVSRASAAIAGANAESLKDAVIKGLKDAAIRITKEQLGSREPLDIINSDIIPALNAVGEAFESKRAFLPQLLMSADAASAAVETAKERMPAVSAESGKEVILATVRGDVHDIGKNIVKVLLESYGFAVHDLGKDVPPETVLECALNTGCRVVGLSALMTTTVPAMEETIRLLKSKIPGVITVVGGAVLNQEYADMIGADYYCRDAMDTVRLAQRIYGEDAL